MKNIEKLGMSVIALGFLVSIYAYPLVPQMIATHWNMEGRPDGFMDKGIGLFLLPAVSLFLFALLRIIPGIDPLGKNIGGFRKQYDGFILVMMNFMLYVHALSVFWNLGFEFDIGRYMIPAVGLLFYYVGILNEHAKRNWFVGIRTPWTISSETVWDKTHMLGAKLFKACGVVALAGIFFPEYSVYLVIVPVLAVVAYLFAYSFFEYRKEKAE